MQSDKQQKSQISRMMLQWR